MSLLRTATDLARRGARRVSDWLGPYTAMWIMLAVGAAVVAGLAAIAAEIYEGVAENDGAAAFDRPVLEAFKAMRTPFWDAAVTNFTNLGGVIGMPIIALLALAFFSWKSRTWRATILIVGVAAGSLLITTVGKLAIGRARPDQLDAVPPFETSPSFPSGHTLNATAIITILVYLAWLALDNRLIKIAVSILGVLFVIAMGLSRVFLGHHWMTDVLAAFAIGLAWAAVVILAHRTYWMVRDVREEASAA
ncbi:MAG TPA: phosphatase PAP2 family protein [Tessaracoccus flavescens]|uniref:Phosphatase PAP2 family protein n=1 Tax=Tessaracoccus flavescens TaxID=399497 RepID=A0A921EQ34_9ACTN|nr:phosphatase PAP2 family protein [Tessaracoccus flavescens]